MKEPLRLLHDTHVPGALREALAASQRTPPALPSAVHASLSGLAAQLPTMGVTTGAATSAATAGTGAVAGTASVAAVKAGVALKVVAVVACLSGAGATAYVVEPMLVASSKAPASTEFRPSTQAALRAPSASTSERRPQPETASPSAPTEPQLGSNEVPAAVSSVESASRRPQDARDELGIAAEAKLLERARRHLSTDPALALTETSQHRERFAAGQMVAERELIAVEALLRLGRRSEAERRASLQLQTDESGLYTKRLRQLLEEF